MKILPDSKPKIINESEAMEKINESKGRFLSVRFTKRTTGKQRVISGRIGVRKGVKGVGMRYKPSDKGLWIIWDKDALVHKSVPTSIQALNINNERFIVEN